MDKLKTLFVKKPSRAALLTALTFAFLFATAAADVAVQTNPKCREILKSADGDKLGGRGTFPDGFPAAPRGSTLCGEKKQPETAAPGSSRVYYLTGLSDAEILAYYRKALKAKGFRINQEENMGGYKMFWYARGDTNEGGTISVFTLRGNSVVDYFVVSYAPLTATENKTSNQSADGNAASAGKQSKSSAANAADGLCRNAYNPIGKRFERKYRVAANGSPTREMTETYRAVTADSYTVHAEYNTNPIVKTDIKWLCTADGLVPNEFDGNRLQTGNGISGKLETLEVSGVSIPAEARWQTGEKWSAKYDVKYAMQFPGNSPVRADGSGAIDGAGEIVGKESVTVPAGTFQAMKVRTRIKMNITVKVGSVTMPMPNQVPVEEIAWYVKDVGKVKAVSTVNGATIGSTELLSFTSGAAR